MSPNRMLDHRCFSSFGPPICTLPPIDGVVDLSLSSVQSNIESLILKIAHSILSGQGFSFDVPSRSATNQLYVLGLDRIVLKEKSSQCPFANISTVSKSANFASRASMSPSMTSSTPTSNSSNTKHLSIHIFFFFFGLKSQFRF